jgi:hypothetical protein
MFFHQRLKPLQLINVDKQHFLNLKSGLGKEVAENQAIFRARYGTNFNEAQFSKAPGELKTFSRTMR